MLLSSYYVLLNIKPVYAIDWLAGFGYRKSHLIIGSASAGTKYQMMITTYYGAGSDSGNNVYLNSHSQTDFDDVRFTSSDKLTELDYWRQIYTASTSAVFYIEVAADLSSNQTIYIYYGNSTVSTTSNGINTFLIYDDFEDAAINATTWTVTAGTVTTNSTYAYQGSKSMKQSATGAVSLNTLPLTANTSCIGFYRDCSVAGIENSMMIMDDGVNGRFNGIYESGHPNNYTYYDGLAYTKGIPRSTGFHKFEISVTVSVFKFYQDETIMVTTPVKVTISRILIGNYWGGDIGWWDCFFTKKTIATPPVNSTWGSEEVPKAFYTAETWNLKLYNFTWYQVESWLGKLYNFSWYQVELWNLLLRNPTWYTVESWLLKMYNFSWSTAESWIGNLYNFSWYPVETFLGTLYNFTWYNAESWLLNLHNYTWYSAESWTLLLRNPVWFNIENWEGLLRNSTFMNVESWNGELLTTIWNTVENWIGSLRNFTWYSAESWIGELLTRNWFTSESWLGLLRNSTFMNVESWNGLLVGRMWFAVETFSGMLYGFVHDYLVYVGISLGVIALGMVIVYSINDDKKKKRGS